MIDKQILKDIADCANCQLDEANLTLRNYTGYPTTPGVRRAQDDREQAERVLDWVHIRREELKQRETKPTGIQNSQTSETGG